MIINFFYYIIIKNIKEILVTMSSKLNVEEANIIIYILKIYCISIFTYYLTLKIIDLKESKRNKVLLTVICGIIAIICALIKYQTNSFYSVMCLVLILSLIFSKFQKKDITYSIMIIVLSLSINYIILFLSTLVTFLPNLIMETQNDYIEFISLIMVYIILVYGFTKIKRFKKRIDIFKE